MRKEYDRRERERTNIEGYEEDRWKEDRYTTSNHPFHIRPSLSVISLSHIFLEYSSLSSSYHLSVTHTYMIVRGYNIKDIDIRNNCDIVVIFKSILEHERSVAPLFPYEIFLKCHPRLHSYGSQKLLSVP